MRIAILVFALGCGGGSKASTTPKNDGASCTTVANAMVGAMMEGKNQENVAETAETLTTIIRTRCDTDGWTADARQCLSTMKTAADAERCGTMLTEEQQTNLVRDQKAKFGAPEQTPAATTGAAPPPPAQGPPPASPMRAEPPKEEAPKSKKGTKTKKTGDPCDGGE